MSPLCRLSAPIVCVLSSFAGCIRPVDVPGVGIEGTIEDPSSQPEVEPKPTKVAEWDWLELEGPLEHYIEMVAFSPDRSLVAAGSNDTICVWASESGKIITRMKLPDTQRNHRLCFTTDGKTLVSDCSEDRMIRFWDVKTGKQKRELPHDKLPQDDGMSYYDFQAFAPGASISAYQALHERTWAYKLMHLSDGKVDVLLMMSPIASRSQYEVAFSPDGKTIAVKGPNSRLSLFDTKTRKFKRELRSENKVDREVAGLRTLQFAPDGKFLIAAEVTGRSDQYSFAIHRYVIWGVEDGRRYWSTEQPGRWIPAGNRYVIAYSKSVIDLLTDQEVPLKNPLTMRDARLAGMSHDGKTIAFVGGRSDNAPGVSVYLSPAPILEEIPHHKDRDLSPAELEVAWSGAVSENLFRRKHCIKTLAAHPHQAIQIASSKLKPVPKAESDGVANLIKLLNDDDPDIRDKASVDIERLAHRFEPILTATLKASEPGEVRNRLTSIMNNTAASDLPPGLKAELAGIGFLEELRTTEARKHLEQLATGAAGSRITEAAAVALKRLDKVPK